MKKILIIAITALFFVSNAYTQVRKYNIVSNGHIVGMLTAVQSVGGAATAADPSEDAAAHTLGENQKVIKISSHFDVHLFITVHVKYDMNCNYENGKLVESSVMTYKDGDLHSSSKGQADNGSYKTIEDGEESTHKGAISYSGGMLYFNEPQGINNVFSEIHATEKPIKMISKGHYMISDPETGHTNQYLYQDGVLQKAIIDHSLFSFSMVLIK